VIARTASRLTRGQVYRVRHPASGGPHGDPRRTRCFVVVSRQELLDSKASRVLCAPINTSDAGLATEISVGADEGLTHASTINCDQLTRLEKSVLTDYIGSLKPSKLAQLRVALRIALDVD
jgi:mRNA interferase MazF